MKEIEDNQVFVLQTNPHKFTAVIISVEAGPSIEVRCSSDDYNDIAPKTAQLVRVWLNQIQWKLKKRYPRLRLVTMRAPLLDRIFLQAHMKGGGQ